MFEDNQFFFFLLFFCFPIKLNRLLSNSVPEMIFWHIPSKAYKKVAPKLGIHKPCVGSINKEGVATQEAEMGIMKLLVKRPSVKVRMQNKLQKCMHIFHKRYSMTYIT